MSPDVRDGSVGRSMEPENPLLNWCAGTFHSAGRRAGPPARGVQK